jgi:hypothetical protein
MPGKKEKGSQDLGPRRCGKNGKSFSMMVGNFGFLGSKWVSRGIEKSFGTIKDLVKKLNSSLKIESTTSSSVKYHR